MGFFSLPLARLVGETGRVICVDLQEKMIASLNRRARRAGLLNRIDARLCTEESLQINDLNGKIDFVLAFAVVHEVPDPVQLLSEMFNALEQGGTLLLSEPRGHVTMDEFNSTKSIAESAGFNIVGLPEIRRSHSVLLEK